MSLALYICHVIYFFNKKYRYKYRYSYIYLINSPPFHVSFLFLKAKLSRFKCRKWCIRKQIFLRNKCYNNNWDNTRYRKQIYISYISHIFEIFFQIIEWKFDTHYFFKILIKNFYLYILFSRLMYVVLKKATLIIFYA